MATMQTEPHIPRDNRTVTVFSLSQWITMKLIDQLDELFVELVEF